VDLREEKHPVVFFDGVCSLCNGFIDFLIKVDENNTLRFAPLQGRTARDILGKERVGTLDSIVMVDSGVFERSDAVLRIFQRLGGPYRLLTVFRLVPRPLRNWAYDHIANNRYRLFGKKDTCRVPTPEERALFLD